MSYHTSVMRRLTVQRRIHSSDLVLTPEEIIERLESLLGPAVPTGFPELSNKCAFPISLCPLMN